MNINSVNLILSLIISLLAKHSTETLLSLRISSGKVALPDQFPYQVSLVISKWNSDLHYCGGVIIREHVVLTAGHCISKNNRLYLYRIFAGSLKRQYKGKVSFKTRVARILVHSGYDEDTFHNDIALLFVKKPFPFHKPNIQPLSLATDVPKPGTACQVSGWGRTETQSVSDVLLYTTVRLYDFDKCKAHDSGLTAGMICTIGPYGEDAGKGDSGGPLTCSGILVGLVSFGYRVDPSNLKEERIGIYTDVSYYHRWIMENGSCKWKNVSFYVTLVGWIVCNIHLNVLQMCF